MAGWRPVAALVGLAALALAACGSGGGSSTSAKASQCSPGTGLTQTATTAKYAMVLNVAPSEAMYTPSQVAAQHLMTGEVMLRGQMNDMTGAGAAGSSASTMPPTTGMGSSGTSTPTSTMPMSQTTVTTMGTPTSTMPMSQTTVTTMGGTNGVSAARHLEVHVCSRSTGQVVQDAQPTITIVDRSSGAMSEQVPIAVMEGINAGTKDLHYGNNVSMPAAHHYAVSIRVGADAATFRFTGPS